MYIIKVLTLSFSIFLIYSFLSIILTYQMVGKTLAVV